MAMSQRKARSVPPPQHVPCSIAITGAAQSRTRRNTPCSLPSGASGSKPGARLPMSNPAHHTPCPAPARRMTARTSRPASLSNASAIASSMAVPSTFRRAESSMVMVAIGPSMARVRGGSAMLDARDMTVRGSGGQAPPPFRGTRRPRAPRGSARPQRFPPRRAPAGCWPRARPRKARRRASQAGAPRGPARPTARR